MFHSYFNEYAFDDISIYLLTSSCTLHRRKFRINVPVHICTNVLVLACNSLDVYKRQSQCPVIVSFPVLASFKNV